METPIKEDTEFLRKHITRSGLFFKRDLLDNLYKQGVKGRIVKLFL